MKLSEYVKKKNGVPIGHPASLRHNLDRALGARNFPAFWNFWNPVFGYYLGMKVFKPIKRVLPAGISLVLTFVFCGAVHDAVTTLLRGRLSLFFTVWFLIMGTVVAVLKRISYDLSGKAWLIRAFANLSVIAVCLVLTMYINTFLHFY